MMIPQMLTPELSTNSSMMRPRRRPAVMALCLLGLLGTAAACGTIEDSKDVANLGPATDDTARERTSTGTTTAPRDNASPTTAATDDDSERDVTPAERDSNDIADRAGSGGSRRRGNTGRVRDLELADGGVIEDVDAGDADAGLVEVDAGEVVEVDAGQADAAAP